MTPATLLSSIHTESTTVTDKQAVAACLQFAADFESQGTMVEPACGAALAAHCGQTIYHLHPSRSAVGA